MKRKIMERQYLKEGIGDTIKKGFKNNVYKPVRNFMKDMFYDESLNMKYDKYTLSEILNCDYHDIEVNPDEICDELAEKYPNANFYKYDNKIYVMTWDFNSIKKYPNSSAFFVLFPNENGFSSCVVELDMSGNANPNFVNELKKSKKIDFMKYDDYIDMKYKTKHEVEYLDVDDDVATSMFDENRSRMKRKVMPKKYLKEAEEIGRNIKGLPTFKKAPDIDNIHISDEKMTGNKIESYIKELNANSENVWRLPSIDELKFIRKFYKDELKDAFYSFEWNEADVWSNKFYKDKRSGEIYNTVMALSDGDLFDFRLNSKATCYVLCISDNPKNEEITDDDIDDDSINSMFESRMKRRKLTEDCHWDIRHRWPK